LRLTLAESLTPPTGDSRYQKIKEINMTGKQIEVYGTEWCSDCMRTKQVLKKHNISYLWHDIGQDKEALAYVVTVNQGRRSVPTIVFPDGSILIEPSNADLEKKLGVAN
jgi:glutaredoxin-like protein